MKHEIKPVPKGLTVEVSDVEGKQNDLLAEFQACREGRCSCPTDEYDKLRSLEIDASSEKIHLRLTAKSGQALDTEKIEECLKHTQSRVNSKT